MTPTSGIASHLHVWTDDLTRYPRSKAPYSASAELLFEYIEDAGIAQAVIVLPMYYEFDNFVRHELAWLSDAQRHLILGGAALKLWQFGPSARRVGATSERAV